MTRLVAVLGYSDGTTDALHPVCDARLTRAALEARPSDVVLFSGWARATAATAEADLMAASWIESGHVRLVDREARTTLGNAIAIARAARRIRADEIVVVTSRWHVRRAAILTRAALLGSHVRVRLATSNEPVAPPKIVREAASWLVVPLQAVVAVRTR
jgi:hypothetical protein